MSNDTIGVGIIGAGGWARYGHIPVLRSLDDFTVVAVSSRKQETADKIAEEYDIAYAFDDYQALAGHPDVDLVVIPAPAPEHARLVRAAIAAGKDVYSEWPLTTTTAESEELLALAEAKGVRHIVGLQRRFAPSARYTRDLVEQGYVGTLRSVRMSVGVNAFGPVMPGRYAWVFDPANFTDVLSIYAGHFGDLLFHTVGFPEKFTAITANQFPHFTIEETGEQIPSSRPDEVMVIGALPGGALFSLQFEGAQTHLTGVQIDITGTDGVLRVTNPRGFENEDDNTVEGVNGDGAALAPLPVPAGYAFLPDNQLDASVQDVAYLYDAYAKDRRNGTTQASNFHDAVRMHHLIDQISASSARFFTSG